MNDEFTNLYANYFGGLIQKETELRQRYITPLTYRCGKEKIFDANKSVSEMAYELGLNIQSLTRLKEF